MTRVLVIGVGPQTRVIPDIVAARGDIELLGFVDTGDSRTPRQEIGGRPVYAPDTFPDELRRQLGELAVLIANDRPDARPKLVARIDAADLPLANLVHPSAVISPSARIGGGALICPGVIVGPGADIGRHAILNTACTIDHDCALEENVIVGPGVHLPGGVTIRSGAFIGVGVSATPGVTVGRNSLIGAGSVITKDIEENVIAAGVPAKAIRPRV
jgi:sugar O-acyltransferase (sialic acid O-acetyltransferase NeuD family)